MQVVSTLLDTVGDIFLLVKKNVTASYRTESLISATKLARVEPLVVVSQSASFSDAMPDISQSLLNQFISFYLQSVALVGEVNGVKIIRVLDRLNPDRDESGFFISLEDFDEEKHIYINDDSRSTLAIENYEYRLPILNKTRLAKEDILDDINEKIESINADSELDKKRNQGHIGIRYEKDRAQMLNDAANMAVGKLVDINIKIENVSQTIPVSFRLVPAILKPNSVIHMLSLHTDDLSLTERWHAFRSGRIKFWKDLILCVDLYDEHKKALINDEDGTYSEIIRRVNATKKFGLLTQNPSLVSASNLFVVTTDDIREVENKLNGKFTNVRTREKAFESTYAMVIAVINQETQRVKFYFRGEPMPIDVSFKEIKAANKSASKGPDIMDMFTAMRSGNQISF